MPTAWAKANLIVDPTLPVEPYLEWALRTHYFGPAPLSEKMIIPLLIELTISAQAFATDTDLEASRLIQIPEFFANPPKGLEESRYLVGIVGEEFFKELRGKRRIRKVIKRFQFGLPVPGLGNVAPTVAKTGPFPAGQVVTGIIDDALAFAHERFRRASGNTRMAYLWDQGSGAELTGAAINKSMQTHSSAGMVDEDAVYKDLGSIDYSLPTHKALGRRAAHGTHVMDLAYGLDPAGINEVDFPIIGVQLPGSTVRDTSGAFLFPHVFLGLLYILQRADLLAGGPVPVVANCSYGTIAGPHDGSSPLEQAIDAIATLRNAVAPFEVVLPSGNNYLYRCHARFSLDLDAVQQVDWRILPDGKTPSFVEIWLPGSGAEVSLRVTTPTGDTSPAIVEGDVYIWKPKTKTLCEVIYTANPAIGGRPLIFVAVAPTAAFDADELAPSGTWNIEITNIGSNQVVIDAWVQRNDTPFGWPILGRQARFEDPNYVRFDNRGADQEDDTPKSYVKRADTINAIATGAAPVVTAGCRLSDLAPANYSGAGIIIGSGRGALDPDAMALSDDSEGCPGILAAGTRSGAVYAMDGTSVAAPQIARWIWKRMLAGLPSDPTAVETHAANEESSRMRPTTPKPTAARGGAGRIDDQAPKRKVDRFTIWPVL